jgi:type IV pilus assembly protein PilC
MGSLDSGRAVKSEFVTFFFRQLSTMLQAGVPIDESLRTLAEGGDRDMGRVADSLHRSVVSGHRLSTAMTSFPQVFSGLTVALVQTGENSGALVAVLAKIADIQEQSIRLKRLLVGGLSYPAILGGTVLFVACLCGALVCSQDASLFQLSGHPVPLPTRILVGLFQTLTSPSFWLVATVVLTTAIGWLKHLAKREPGDRRRAHSLVLKVPLLGKLISRTAEARVALVLGNSLELGIPILFALQQAERMTWNQELRSQISKTRSLVKEGYPLATALRDTNIYSGLHRALIHVGEESGTLVKVLRRISKDAEEEVAALLEALLQSLEPLLLVGSGGLVLLVALAALAPMFSVLEGLA